MNIKFKLVTFFVTILFLPTTFLKAEENCFLKFHLENWDSSKIDQYHFYLSKNWDEKVLPNDLEIIHEINFDDSADKNYTGPIEKFFQLYILNSKSQSGDLLLLKPGDTLQIAINETENSRFKFQITQINNSPNYLKIYRNLVQILKTNKLTSFKPDTTNFNELFPIYQNNLINCHKLIDSVIEVEHIKDDNFINFLVNYSNDYNFSIFSLNLNKFNKSIQEGIADSLFTNYAVPYINNKKYDDNDYNKFSFDYSHNLAIKIYNRSSAYCQSCPRISNIISAGRKFFTNGAFINYFINQMDVELAILERMPQEVDSVKYYLALYNDSIPQANFNYFQDYLNKKTAVAVGSYFPKIDVKDTSGNVLNTQSFYGNFSYVYVWATWCKPCVEHLKSINEFAQLLNKYHVKLYLISEDSQISTWKKYVKEHLKDYVNLSSPNNQSNSLDKALLLSSIPQGIMLNPEGKIIDMNSFLPGDPFAEEWIKKLTGN